MIVVGNDTVKNVLMNMDEPLGNDEILKLNILLNSFLQGLTLNDINIELVHTMKVQAGMHADILEGVFSGIVEAIHEADNMEIYTSGATNIFKYPELADTSKASELISAFEEKQALAEFVKDTAESEYGSENTGIQVYIGNESPVKTMKDCSVVTATYDLGEGMQGTIGIIGPKRMDYENVMDNLKTLKNQLDNIFKKT